MKNIAMRLRCQRKTPLEKQMVAMNSACYDFQEIRPRGGRFIVEVVPQGGSTSTLCSMEIEQT